jgi:hypothetical protein
MNPFYRRLADRIRELGGMFNAHLHLDRAGTLDDAYMADAGHRILEQSHISLHRKHGLIGALHTGPAYNPDDLTARVDACLDEMVACNTVRADTMVDVTPDRVGLSALETLRAIKRRRAHAIDVRLGAYTPLGFKASEPRRWTLFEEGAQAADFIGSLPEADDTDDHPDHIGFMEHCTRVLDLASRLKRMVHVHTDQRNEPTEHGTEDLITVARRFAPLAADNGEPLIWAVHMISPSTYDEARFQKLVEGLLECNIGVICCPSAAIGMRQLRPVRTPTYNSIPRVLELLAAGVHVRLASDNIADICSPSTTADLTDEVYMLSAAIRYYNIDILARLAAGQRLTDGERAQVRDHLDHNDREIRQALDEAGQISF